MVEPSPFPSTSGPASFSCVPCAKRKVRCDKRQPCSHCKRRTKDVCEYPTANGPSLRLSRSTAASASESETIGQQRIRILELEQALLQSAEGLPDTSTVGASSIDRSSSQQGIKRNLDGTPRGDRYFPPQAALVTHNEQTAYIEA
jgi:hypothetical protein